MATDALEKAKKIVLDERIDFNSSSSSVAGYVIAAGLIALAEQLGNMAEAIRATKGK